MKTDARIRCTKMIIKKNFMELLKIRPISKITVKDICEGDDTNRTIFYKHYDDCFDLLKQIEDGLISELQQLAQESHHRNSTDIFKKTFGRIKENGDLYITLSSNNGDSTFLNRILNLCYE